MPIPPPIPEESVLVECDNGEDPGERILVEATRKKVGITIACSPGATEEPPLPWNVWRVKLIRGKLEDLMSCIVNIGGIDEYFKVELIEP